MIATWTLVCQKVSVLENHANPQGWIMKAAKYCMLKDLEKRQRINQREAFVPNPAEISPECEEIKEFELLESLKSYLTEEESAVIGKWASESVEELLGDGPQTSMEGVDNINDALRLDFKNDRNVTVIYKGEEIGTFPWSVALGYCAIESDNPSLSVAINDDGTLKVDYSNDEDYYTFHCVKSDGE